MDKSTDSLHAPWLGITGLDLADELGLIEHVKEDEYETYGKPFELSAFDLTYVGKVVEGNAVVHYWQLRDSLKRLAYASIGIAEDVFVYDYGLWTTAHDRVTYN